MAEKTKKSSAAKRLFNKDENAPSKMEIFANELSSQMVKLMENCGEWHKTWNGPLFKMPYNPFTEKRYSGGNSMLLMITSWACGYHDDRWLTIPQLKSYAEKLHIDDQELRVKAGEKGTHVLYPNRVWYIEKPGDKPEKISEKEAKEIIAQNSGIIPKELTNRIYFTDYVVFNAAQIPNFPEDNNLEQISFTENDRNKLIDSFVEYSQIPIKYGSYDPCYSQFDDIIFMPKPENFDNKDDFYSVEMHEFFHATGHKTRENREMSHFGKSYGFEELRAELFSVIVSRQFGIPLAMDNAAAYLKYWNEQISGNSGCNVNAIFSAAKDAMQVFQYIVDFSEGIQPKAKWLPELSQEMKKQEVLEQENNSGITQGMIL